MSTPFHEENDPEYRRIHDRSYKLLLETRKKAAAKSKYSSTQTRHQLQTLFTAKFGKPAHEWQIDAVEAIYLGLDCILAAGTGMGKTIPFMMMLLPDQKKRIAVISPLKVLQQDQQKRFQDMGLSAARVNGDTWRRKKLRDSVRANDHQALFAGPEMWLKHDGFRKSLRESGFLEDTSAIVIDEGHCISQWGGDFRKAYAELDKLRALFPPGTPVLLASATLNKTALRDVRTTLSIDPEECFHLNLGNDRANISTEVHHMKNAHDFDALEAQLEMHPTDPTKLKKTLIFTNTVKLAQSLPRKLQQKDKRRVMRNFESGRTKILFATETVGMGADIPDIEVVIHFGVPSSLTVFIQRMGRAGRLSSIRARAVLLVEKSMFQRRKKRKPKKKKKGKKLGEDDSDDPDAPVSVMRVTNDGSVQDDDGDDIDGMEDGNMDDQENSGEPSMAIDRMDDEKYEWIKKVESVMREWITTEACPRDISDIHYLNPPRKAPTGACCDRPLCKYAAPVTALTNSRPCTPVCRSVDGGSTASSPHSSPSKSPNKNGKRQIVSRQKGPAKRTGDHLENATSRLRTWRFRMARDIYPDSSLIAEAILPDSVLTKIASNARLKTIEDLLPLEWMLGRRHGQEVLDLLVVLDEAKAKRNAEEIQQRRDTKAAETLRAREEKKAIEAQKRAENKRVKQSRTAPTASKSVITSKWNNLV
ncbi:P-loop containing nucleoside triphosphate hydrolase protein [Mycena floridula]|nr:P-loop containing nucleoside triphosphate hydrolase protein [Mycena floridula]